jgi:alpha-tubulin suppressor-like RCC1 family protein/putative cell wall-binding protein
LALGLLTPLGSTIASAATSDVSRLAGPDRFATSAAISAASFYPGVPVAYVASGMGFPDALAGASVAGAKGGPVLLSTPTGLPDPVMAELDRLNPQKIVVFGGTAVISDAVKSNLAQYTTSTAAEDVTRLAGADRFATSAAISAAAFEPGVPVAYIASGMDFPDALSGAPVAGVQSAPVLLSDQSGLSASVRAELSRLKPKKIVVLGGTALIPDAVKSNLVQYTARKAAGDVSRMAGADRFATSAAISAASFDAGVPVAYVSSGMNFPDALTGAAAAGGRGGPVLLTAPTRLSEAVKVELGRLKPQKIIVLGGTQLVAKALSDSLASYATGAVTQSVTGDGAVSHGRTTVTAGDGKMSLTVFAPDLDVAAESLREIVAADALIGVPIEVAAQRIRPGQTLVLERSYSAPLPEGATATWMYFDDELGGWMAVPSTLSEDRRTVRAEVDHLSLWDDVVAGTSTAISAVRDAASAAGQAAVAAGQAVGNVVGEATRWAGEQFVNGSNGLAYGIGAIFDGRVGAPECTGDVPAWVDQVIYVEDFNNPVLWCVGRDPQRDDLLVVKARANRGYGYGYETAIDPAWVYNSTNEHGALSAILTVAGDMGGSMAQSMESLTFGGQLVGSGEEVSFGFDEAEARASLEIGEPLVRLRLPDATGFLFSILARLVMEQAVNLMDGPIAAVIAVAACADAATTAEGPLEAAGAVLTCLAGQDEAIAAALAKTLGPKAADPRALGKSIGTWVGKASVYLALVAPVQATIDYLVEGNGPEEVRLLRVYLTSDGGGGDPDPSDPATIIVAHSHGDAAYALRADGTVWAWGSNVYGQLGTGDCCSSPRTATQVRGLPDIASVSAGQRQGYAVGKDGTVWAWGNNLEGELGNGTTEHSDVPRKVAGIDDVVQLTSQGSVVALLADGTVWSWGDGVTLKPAQVGGLSDITQIDERLALRSDGTVWAWGGNGNGQLGNGTFEDSSTAVQVAGLTSVTRIVSSTWSNFAQREDGTWWAWGENYYGQLGIGTTTDSPVPVQVDLPSEFDIVPVYGDTYAYSPDGRSMAWGDNRFGELNVGGSYVGNAPVTRPASISIGGVSSVVPQWGNYAFAVMADGTVSAWGATSNWGEDDWGLLGNRENCYAEYTNGQYRDVAVLGLTDVVSLTASHSDVYALREDGTIWGWGNMTSACSPVQIGM